MSMIDQYDDSRFTDRSRIVMELANDEAHRLHHSTLELAHLFLGLSREGAGVAANVLKNLGVDLATARTGIEESLAPHADPEPGELPVSSELREALKRSLEEARTINHNYVGTEHLLLALCQFPESPHAHVLANSEVTLQEVRTEVLNLLGHGFEGG